MVCLARRVAQGAAGSKLTRPATDLGDHSSLRAPNDACDFLRCALVTCMYGPGACARQKQGKCMLGYLGMVTFYSFGTHASLHPPSLPVPLCTHDACSMRLAHASHPTYNLHRNESATAPASTGDGAGGGHGRALFLGRRFLGPFYALSTRGLGATGGTHRA